MDNSKHYDVFISYRWEGGDQIAWLLHDHLTNAGYRVYLDMEGYDHGDFNERILGIIRTCRDLIPILSPGALEPRQGRDYLREELREAVNSGVNVVPYLLPGFQWPKETTDWLDKVKGSTGASYNKEYFPATLRKVKSLLTASPRPDASPEPQIREPEPPAPAATPTEIRRARTAEELEPAFTLQVLEPDQKRLFSSVYSAALKARIRRELQGELTQLRRGMEQLLQRPDGADALEAYQKARLAMRLVEEQMGAYRFWDWDADTARTTFMRNYSDELLTLRSDAAAGVLLLDPEGRKQLSVFAAGLDQLIQALKG